MLRNIFDSVFGLQSHLYMYDVFTLIFIIFFILIIWAFYKKFLHF